MKRVIVVFMVLFLLGPLLYTFAQQAGETPPVSERASDRAAEIEERFRLATSSEDYPVTPGDIYSLRYQQGSAMISNQLLVEADYGVNLGMFGRMVASEMTFGQFKQEVFNLILSGYPRSMPSLTISSLGIFSVHVRGETPRARLVTAWGLMRVSDVIEDLRGPYSSLRNVEVVSRGGESRTYDLFKALRLGGNENDPYVKPGDTIVLSRSERRVQVAGEVRQPGTYDLLAGEQLRELVELYGDGLTSNADASRVRIERITGERARVTYLSLAQGYQRTTMLENGDILTVPAKSANLLTVFFEGAILPQPVATPGTTAEGAAAGGTRDETGTPASAQYNRVIYSFKEGESLSDALRAVRTSIAPLADLSKAFLVREGRTDPISVDLRVLISSTVSSADLPLQTNDRIVIPLLRFFVSISGAVANPGTYPFAPNRTYRHYIDLAGGTAQDPPENVVVTDSNGDPRDPQGFIQAEDRIFVIPATILVQGAVFAPGSFAYRAGLPVLYYLHLAGGIDPERNGIGGVSVFDSQGKRRKTGELLRPGDRIYVPTCGMLYNLNRFSGLVVAIVTALATTITIVNAFRP